MGVKQVFAMYDWMAHEGEAGFKYCPYCGTALVLKEVDHRQRPMCSQCHFVHFRNPYPGVSVFVVHEGNVLLGRRQNDFGIGQWALPSGYIEYDEDFLTAAVREVKEETGLDVAVQAIVNVESSFVAPRFHFLTVYLLAGVVGGKLTAGDDVTAVDWFPLSGPLPDMAFAPDVTIIRQYHAGTLVQFPVDSADAGRRQHGRLPTTNE